jgi:hypothetical protein
MSAAGLNVTACLSEISGRPSDAAAIAKAAVTCAESGSEHEAIRIAIDLDELLYEVQTLHGALCLVGRIMRSQDVGLKPTG